MGLTNNPEDRGPILLIVIVVVFSIAWVFTLLRAYVRIYLTKNIAADDWWMFASMVVYTGYTIDAIIGIQEGGTGKHITELTTEETYLGLKTWYISEAMYAPLSAMVRTSVALFLLRVATNPIHRWIIIADITIVWIVGVVFLFIVLFQCSPPSYFYDQALGAKGTCMDINVVPNAVISQSVIGAVCDLVFAGLPVAMLWNVQLNKRTKVVIALLLSMGAIAGVALLVRIPFVKVLAITPDFLYETIDVAIWSVLEPSLGIIAGCVATLRPLFKNLGFDRKTISFRYPNYPPGGRYYGGSSAHSNRRHKGSSGPDSNVSSSRRSWMCRKTSYLQKLGDESLLIGGSQGPRESKFTSPSFGDNATLVGSSSLAYTPTPTMTPKNWPLSLSSSAKATTSDIELQPHSNHNNNHNNYNLNFNAHHPHQGSPSPTHELTGMSMPPRAIISTNIGAGRLSQCGEAHHSGEGISVHTSFSIESRPRSEQIERDMV